MMLSTRHPAFWFLEASSDGKSISKLCFSLYQSDSVGAVWTGGKSEGDISLRPSTPGGRRLSADRARSRGPSSPRPPPPRCTAQAPR